jgi:flavodoxin I
MKIGLVYGTNTGVTEIVAEKLDEVLRENGIDVEIHDIASVDFDVIKNYKTLIIAVPTWNDGELQDDWDEVFDQWCDYNFDGLNVAFVGTGDQEAYHENFLDAIGKMAVPVRESGGNVFGRTSTDGFNHTTSVGDDGDGYFCGLAIDEDNEPELTDERVENWVKQIKSELGI